MRAATAARSRPITSKALVHLEHHDVSVVRVSRAPLAKLEAYRKRMGWRIKWVSSHGNDFNFDYHVSATPDEIKTGKVYYNYDLQPFQSDEMGGWSVFYKDDDGCVFHTYSTYARGDELIDTSYVLLDMTPKGRNETGPNYNLGDWVRRHDEYEPAVIKISPCSGDTLRGQDQSAEPRG